MKRIISLLIACVLTVVCAVGFVGCGKDGTNGKNGTNGQDGVGIADTKIENGKLYVKYTNGNDYVELGQVKGENGKDGNTPTIEISSDGYWVIGGIKTQVKAVGKDGANGDDGKSAYQIWLDNGHEGSEEDFLNWLKGDQGQQGQQGQQGKSAYEIFKEYYPDYTGSEMEWITAVASGDKCALFGHKYDDGVITKQPTKDETGEMTYTCSVCKGTKVEVLPKLEVPTTYEENGRKYVNWGTYPQTRVSDAAALTELNKLTETNSRGYYSYNGEEYAKVTATPYATGDAYLYSDGTAVTSGTTEWFKVEPIKWKVGVAETDAVKVISAVILDISYYYENEESRTIDGETIYSNNYKYSTLREFLNNGFYNTAFTLMQQSAILTTEVDNGVDGTNYTRYHKYTMYACENTFDKIYALSYRESSMSYFGDSTETAANERFLKVTDYAKAKGVYWGIESPTYGGHWWLRSPNCLNERTASYVHASSGLMFDSVSNTQIGVAPAMRLSVA